MDGSLVGLLREDGYPGRGLVLAQFPSGWCVVYFLTGRSEASRDRELVRRGAGPADGLTEGSAAGVGGGWFVQPRGATGHDPLRHYRAVAATDRWTVVGNGDQVDQIVRALAEAEPVAAVQDIDYEADPPLRTPRISVVCPRRPDRPAVITRAYASTLEPDQTLVGCWTARELDPGHVLVTTTYHSDGLKVVATDMPPTEAHTDAATPEELLAEVWDNLPKQLRVAAVLVSPSTADPLASVRVVC